MIADDAGATVTVDGWFTNPYAGAGSSVSLEAGDPSDTVNLSSGSVSEASGVTGIIVNGSNNALTMNAGDYFYIASGTGNFCGGMQAANDVYSQRAA